MVTATPTVDRLGESEHRGHLLRAVIASTIGTTIEWYDFFLYSLASGLVFAKLYFPKDDPLRAPSMPLPSMRWASSRGRSGPRSSAITATGSGANRR